MARTIAQLVILAALAVGSTAGPAQNAAAGKTGSPGAPAPLVAPRSDSGGAADDIAATERSVVRVVTVAIVNGEVVGFGHGSGFAISPNRIVTNAHVVADAAQYPDNVVIGVVPSEGSRSYPGRLIRTDPRRDLAIVELQDGHLPVTSIYTGPVSQREKVFALGYPGNVDLATAQNMDDFIRPRAPIASDGILSATDTVGGVPVLVHDANIARGNSGGPLVDGCGRVIGVNSFISRADDGDSPFSFAITVRELAAFLQDAGQRFTAVASACLTADQQRARDEALSAEEQARIATAARAQAQREEDNARRLEGLRADTAERRESYMALAFVLFGIAILSGAASFMYAVQEKPRERRAAILSGILLAIGSAIVFFLRPSPADVRLPETATEPPKVATQSELYGRLLCIVDRNRGRITVSAGEDTRLAITPDGCVNGRTQYARASQTDPWTRTLVPNQDATVSRLSYDPAKREYVIRHYLLSLEAMEALRRQRDSISAPGCTADPAALATLSAREAAIANLLPPQANEEIFSRCQETAE